MLHALTREISPDFSHCQLTHLERVAIDLELARAQHRAYESSLARAGCEIRRLPPADDLPDSVFVEDVAVVLNEIAVLTRPGAPTRRPEVVAIASALEPFRPVRRIESPGTLDGGDVLRIGRRLLVGRSKRSNEEGIGQLRRIVGPFGYSVTGVKVEHCLHLKAAATLVAENVVLIQRSRVDPRELGDVELLDADPSEPASANALRVGGVVILPAAHPRTRERLEKRGIRTEAVEVSEIAKAEGGVTCCSLIFEVYVG